MDNNRCSIYKRHFSKVEIEFFSKDWKDDWRNILDCEPVDLTEYESRQEQIVQQAIEKWLQT